MKTVYTKIICLAVAALGLLCSCEDFLDALPDNRTQLDSPQKIKELMMTCYPLANYAMVCELSADNFIDNRAPNAAGLFYNVTAYDRMDNDLFSWTDVRGYDFETDSPYLIWEQYYQTIAAANSVLEAIEKLEKEGKLTESMDAQKGEALILRAYSHFILVNIFSMPYKDATASQSDIAITYMKKPETVVGAKYERNTVAEVYQFIQEDIEAGLPLIDDSSYDVPAYHFTSKAAHAFAAKFYLYTRQYQKVVDHADYVLGQNPTAVLRDWATIYNNSEQQAYAYFSADSPANLLLIPTQSTQMRRFINKRYGSNGDALKGSYNDAGPTWSGRPAHLTGWIWTYGQNYGLFIPKVEEFFEFTDKVAGIGYCHIMRTEFTTDAALLDRAEAKIFLNDIAGAVADLQYWNQSHRNTTPLTLDVINRFYTPGKKYFVFDFHTQEMSSTFTVSEDQKPLVDCVLHFRRIERIFEGDRWFDIRRYGIELEHIQGEEAKKHLLTHDDLRRAIQIPNDVLGAGLSPNPRPSNSNKPMVVPAPPQRVDWTVEEKR